MEILTPPQWVADDKILTRFWEAHLNWRIEMIQADQSQNRESEIERLTRLAHDIDLENATITVAEAERRWGKQNLRGNAKGRLVMWQSGKGSPWLTTTYAMEKLYGPEPGE